MKSTARYLLPLLLVLTLCVCLLVACTGNETPSDTEAPTSPVTDPAESGDITDPETQPETDPETRPETDYFEATRIETVAPDEDKVPDMEIAGSGYDIYRLTAGKEWGYRYGCTYLYNDDGSVDAYFACVGTVSGEWDWIAYRHSPEGGETWEDERIVLTPTQGSMDHFSNCDPCVVYFDGYYYLGYTSTLNSIGTCNNLFVARSKNPDGPFEKWNGSGWGGTDPQPIVYFDEAYTAWGIGEPSFVELNGTLYIYYTNTAVSGDYTMVATADATDENWPATMQFHGVAVKKNTDSLDVKYVEEWGKFIAIATGDRMGPASWLGVYESNDGLHFELVDITREGTYSHLHNAGISSRPNGHIRITEDADKLRVIYAYGEGWGTWNTRIQPITLTLSEGNDLIAERTKACLADEHLRDTLIPEEERHIAMVRPAKDVYTYTVDKGSFLMQMYVYDTYFDRKQFDRSAADELEYVVYDESVVTIDGLRVTVVGVGTTPVMVRYAGCEYLFHITITEEPVNTGNKNEAIRIEPVRESYTLYLGERTIFRPQLRPRVFFGDGSFTEYYVDNNQLGTPVTYTGYDESIISVSETGIVIPKKTGTTTVTMTCCGLTTTTTITITDKLEDGQYKLPESAQVTYHDLDFTTAGDETVLSGLNSTQMVYDADEAALKVVVTGEDPIITIPFSSAPDTYSADEYGTLTITYMVPEETSSVATTMQIFFCTGDVTQPSESYQTVLNLVCDGEYHTLTIQLSNFSFWTGDIHTLRIDYFNRCNAGDIMYIKSITLSE